MRRVWALVPGVILLIAASPRLAAAWPEARPASHAFACREVQIPMRDGIKLAADLYLPKEQGPFPVIIERTPYGKLDCKHPRAPYLAERGYAVIIEDVRGRFRSPGEFYQFRDEGWGERRDGYDTIEWAGTQSWSTGKVGTLGVSYSCFNQNMTAVTQPPHLAAMFCSDSESSWFSRRYTGGALTGMSFSWLMGIRELLKPFLENHPPTEPGTIEDWQRWHQRRVGSNLGIWESFLTPQMADLLAHPTYDDYWKQYAPIEHIDKFTVPIYYTSGWYDRYPRPVSQLFNAVREHGGSAIARSSVRLLIGPWLHGQGMSGRTSVTGDLDFGRESMADFPALEVLWFDYHLKGIDNGIMKEPPVRIFVMGSNVWRTEREFPLSRAVQTTFYLSSAKSGSIDSLNDGTLSRTAPGGEDRPDTYTFDPKKPIPSIGGQLFIEPMGARDHRPADRQSLTFTTPPMKEDMEITGMSTAELFVSSSADDTDFVVTLSDVDASGYTQLLQQAILRASRRESLSSPSPIVPNQVYKLTIPIDPTSDTILAGHRLRLTVSSSSFPRWLPSHNTFAADNEQAPYAVATNTLYHDAQHPSALIVPVVPKASPTR